VTNLSFHDLTINKSINPAAAKLLGLGLKFIISPETTSSFSNIDFSRFCRDTHLKTWFAGAPILDNKPSKLYVKSKWTPPSTPTAIDNRLHNFSRALRKIIRSKKVDSNLLPYQHDLLRELRENNSIVIANTDKGLGPCTVDLHQYVDDGLDHLSDASAYQILSPDQARRRIHEIRSLIEEWLFAFEAHPPAKHGTILDMEADYICEKLHTLLSTDPYNYFYLL